MNNVDYVASLIENLATDEDFLILKEERLISNKDQKRLINGFLKKAQEYDNLGKFLSYYEWRELFLEVASSFEMNKTNYALGPISKEKYFYRRICDEINSLYGCEPLEDDYDDNNHYRK